jgi:hypothetical protein
MSEGANNINTTTQTHAPENQEVVGSEGQRLPAYEVNLDKGTLKDGFKEAASNVGI